MIYLMWSLRYGRLAGSNPWGAVGLEWTTTSPPPTENFAETPIVTWDAYDYQRRRWRGTLPERRWRSTHGHHPPALAHQFDDLEQQTRSGDARHVGASSSPKCCSSAACSWSTSVYRSWYPEAFAAASHETRSSGLGTINTAVLITSSLTMALAVHAAQTGERRRLIVFLIVTMLLGGVFLGIKAFEYYTEFVEHHVPGPRLSVRGRALPRTRRSSSRSTS